MLKSTAQIVWHFKHPPSFVKFLQMVVWKKDIS